MLVEPGGAEVTTGGRSAPGWASPPGMEFAPPVPTWRAALGLATSTRCRTGGHRSRCGCGDRRHAGGVPDGRCRPRGCRDRVVAAPTIGWPQRSAADGDTGSRTGRRRRGGVGHALGRGASTVVASGRGAHPGRTVRASPGADAGVRARRRTSALERPGDRPDPAVPAGRRSGCTSQERSPAAPPPSSGRRRRWSGRRSSSWDPVDTAVVTEIRRNAIRPFISTDPGVLRGTPARAWARSRGGQCRSPCSYLHDRQVTPRSGSLGPSPQVAADGPGPVGSRRHRSAACSRSALQPATARCRRTQGVAIGPMSCRMTRRSWTSTGPRPEVPQHPQRRPRHPRGAAMRLARS